MTAVFGIAMVIIGSTIEVEGKGARLIVNLAEQLEGPLGTAGKWVFLVGAFGAVFSSLLGVWQAVPYLFSDLWGLLRRNPEETSEEAAVDTRSLSYRGYLVGIAVVPMAGLFMSFREIQKLYAVVGAAFVPLLAIALLILNGRTEWVGRRFRNGWPATLALSLTLAFFAWAAWMKWQ
jgi:hypothetical protein